MPGNWERIKGDKRRIEAKTIIEAPAEACRVKRAKRLQNQNADKTVDKSENFLLRKNDR